jgi:hypothetical protein
VHAGFPQTLGLVGSPPHVSPGFGQVAPPSGQQLSVPLQPSGCRPQFTPRSAHVFGVHVVGPLSVPLGGVKVPGGGVSMLPDEPPSLPENVLSSPDEPHAKMTPATAAIAAMDRSGTRMLADPLVGGKIDLDQT